jgi:hypothetical protein
MSAIKCFLLEETHRCRLYLRRFVFSKDASCPGGNHDASIYIGEADIVYSDSKHPSGRYLKALLDLSKYDGDIRWPIKCEHCDYHFTDDDQRQVNQYQLYRRADTGEIHQERQFPAGAIWESWWLAELDTFCGPDGKCYMCMTPGGEWIIDSVASNCTRRDDREHRCWPRRGEAPNFTVDKSYGKTCDAGAGSIQCGSYHGFLRDGHLVD